ncbi:hypothetical protein BSZ39_05985 [Bowdeniella nasicola]|uniref:Uncharacterized protein n=1 Tax=Bowdeniella nasicola TaxID=208480 RepID=A0A1Q5Q339_9ACTO|nr:hypothetical protein BSZ39_05985 [Bowdeniella nasicola]
MYTSKITWVFDDARFHLQVRNSHGTIRKCLSSTFKHPYEFAFYVGRSNIRIQTQRRFSPFGLGQECYFGVLGNSNCVPKIRQRRDIGIGQRRGISICRN